MKRWIIRFVFAQLMLFGWLMMAAPASAQEVSAAFTSSPGNLIGDRAGSARSTFTTSEQLVFNFVTSGAPASTANVQIFLFDNGGKLVAVPATGNALTTFSGITYFNFPVNAGTVPVGNFKWVAIIQYATGGLLLVSPFQALTVK
jgi:hypothetical protein